MHNHTSHLLTTLFCSSLAINSWQNLFILILQHTQGNSMTKLSDLFSTTINKTGKWLGHRTLLLPSYIHNYGRRSILIENLINSWRICVRYRRLLFPRLEFGSLSNHNIGHFPTYRLALNFHLLSFYCSTKLGKWPKMHPDSLEHMIFKFHGRHLYPVLTIINIMLFRFYTTHSAVYLWLHTVLHA